MNSRVYRSPMKDWSWRASGHGIMRGPEFEGEGGQYAFSPALHPVITHPDVVSSEPELAVFLLAQRGFAYLDFTMVLEQAVILPIARALAHGRLGIGAGWSLVHDAKRICFDEQHHAADAVATKLAIAELTQIAPLQECFLPPFLSALEAKLDEAPPERRQLTKLVFGVVSETLVTEALSKIPLDNEVLPVMRRSVHAHARDEVVHHKVFTQVGGMFWDGLSEADQAEYGPLFAEFMALFLQPDVITTEHSLVAAGFSEHQSKTIVSDIYDERTVRTIRFEGAGSSRRFLSEEGIMEHPAVIDTLGSYGFLG